MIEFLAETIKFNPLYFFFDGAYTIYDVAYATREDFYVHWIRQASAREFINFLFMSPEKLQEYQAIIEASKFIGAGLCVIGVIGAAVGIDLFLVDSY